ncbi:MAG TPA: hypothetical protein VGQ57_04210 [Polyangiaceae bacterium]|jgi:hypothetical protein|nr:hypothetical protein [Polyangiaceae bacterium]
MASLRAVTCLSSLLFVALASGCAASVKQATKEAGQTAVNASAKEAKKPAVRESMAEVIGDPQIRASTTQLSHAVADGVLDALMEKERIDKATAATDAFLEHMNRSLAKSVQHDLSPALAGLMTETFERTLSELKTEQPAMKQAIGETAREVGRQVALGFQDAVVEAEARRDHGEKRPGEVLASVGRASDAVLRSTSIVLWVAVVALVAAIAGGLVWLSVRLRQERTLNRDLRRRVAV